MLNQKLTDKPQFTGTLPDDALLHVVLPNDFTQGADGSDYKILVDDLLPQSGQDNIDIRKYVVIDSDDTINEIVANINALPAFTINEKQSVWFVSRIVGGQIPQRLVKFKMMNRGKGNYGTGGTVLFSNDLELVYDNIATILDVENDPTTDTVLYGDITGQTVSEWLNEQIDAVVIQPQDEGYTIFKGSVDGETITYLWVGEAGVYGDGESQSTMEDFQVLSETSVTDDNNVKKNPSPEILQTIQDNITITGALNVGSIATFDVGAYVGGNLQVDGSTVQTLGQFFADTPNSESDGPTTLIRKDYFELGLNDIVNIKTGWKSPQDYGAVGDGVADDTAAIQECVDENDNVFLYGSYKTTAQILGRANQNIFCNNATIRNYDAGERTIVFAFVSGFSITGKLTIVGNGKADGSSIGLFLAGCSGFSIQGLTVTDMAGRGIHLSGEGASRGDRGSLIDISLQDNWIGLETDLRSEYHTISNINAGGNQLAVSILSGNIVINGGSISDNDAGVYIGAGDNNSHGMLSNLNINHNTDYNLKAEGVTFGESISACHFYGTVTENIIIEDSKGLNFTGCFIDGLITNTDANTPKGTHLFTGCTMLASTSFSGSGKDVDVLFNKNTTLDGGLWPDNTEFFDSTVIHTTGDESKTGAFTLEGIFTLDGLGLNLTKYQVFSSDIGYIGLGNYAISGGSATAFGIRGLDGLQLSGGTDVDMTIKPNGNVLINTSTDSGNGEKLQVNGQAKVGVATLSTSAPQLQQVQNFTGWAQYSGTNYTIGAPLVINAGNTSVLANNGSASTITTQLPTGVTAFVNTANGKITPQNDGDFYVIDIRFKATSSSVDGVIDIGIDIGGAMGIIRQHTISLRKGIGVEQRVALSFPVFSGSTFVANGGEVKVSSIVGNTSIYDVTFVVDRTHKAK